MDRFDTGPGLVFENLAETRTSPGLVATSFRKKDQTRPDFKTLRLLAFQPSNTMDLQSLHPSVPLEHSRSYTTVDY